MKLFFVEPRVYGYILVAGNVLYEAGSLRYHRIKHLCFNLDFEKCKRTLYSVSPCN